MTEEPRGPESPAPEEPVALDGTLLRSWAAVAPLVSYLGEPPIQVAQRFEFGHGVSIERDIEQFKAISPKESLTRDEKFCLSRAEASLVAQFQAILITDSAMEAPPRAHMTYEDVAIERLHLARLAVFLVDPGSFWFLFVGFYFKTEESELTWWDFAHSFPHPRDRPQRMSALTDSVLREAKLLFTRFCGGIRYESALWTALQFTYLSLDEQPWQVGFLELWTTLEALFAPDRFRDTSFWLCFRIALFLGGSDAEVVARFRRIYDWYDLRSLVIHGTTKGHDKGRVFPAYENTEETVRACLRRILEDDDLLAAFGGTEKEAYLVKLEAGWEKVGKARDALPAKRDHHA